MAPAYSFASVPSMCVANPTAASRLSGLFIPSKRMPIPCQCDETRQARLALTCSRFTRRRQPLTRSDCPDWALSNLKPLHANVLLALRSEQCIHMGEER